MMNKKTLFNLFGLLFALFIIPGHALAGTMVLDSFVDQTTEPINLPATNLLVATVNTTAAKGGNDATATTVTIGGTVVAADIAEVCVDYSTVPVSCVTNPGSLTNISLSLGGNEKGGAAFDYRVTLNGSSGGKTMFVTVESITNIDITINGVLPASTATRNIAATSTPPSIDTPTFSSVATTSATLGGHVVSAGAAPAADAQGTVWNHTGGLPTENATAEGSTPGDNTAFTHSRTGMNSADQVFFRAYVEQSATKYYTSVASFHTYPANDPTGFSIDQVTTDSMRINWTDSSESGDAGGSIVIVSGVDGNFTAPGDGNDYSGDPVWPFSVSSGTDDWVAYKGQGGSSVTLTNLPENSQFWVTIYSYSGTGAGTSGVRYKPTTNISGTETTLTTPPVVGNPTFSSVLNNGATLGIDSVTGTDIDDKGTAWNYTTGVTEANNPSSFGSGEGGFSHDRTGMNSADQIFFKGYAHNPAGYTLTSESSFHTYPSNDPTIGTFTSVDSSNITINWTNSSETGDAAGTIVVVSEVDASFTAPSDGVDYSPDATYPFGTATSGGNDFVVYSGTGTSVTISSLPPETTFYVAIYSASGLGTSGTSGVRYKTPTSATGNETTTVGASTPSIDTPTFSSVAATSATLGGHVIGVGTAPVADKQGTVWNHTGGLPTENLAYEGSTPADDTAFTHLRDTPAMNSADQVFFRAFVEQSSTPYYSSVASFFTYPANDPTIGGFTGVEYNNITINWTNSSETGDGAGTIVVVSTADDGFTLPQDGTDYAPNAVYPFTNLGGNDYVVYTGTGNSVTISSLPSETTFYVAVYSASGLGTSGISGVRYKIPTTATGNATTTVGPTPPSIDTPTFGSVTATSALLGGHVVSVGATPAADAQGTVWNHTGSLPTENAQAEGTAPADDTAFTHLRDTPAMNSADQIFFRAYVEQSATRYYTSLASFHTYPANDPSGFSISPPTATSLTINWTNSTETGDAGGSIVVVTEVDSSITAPSDGTDYTPDASYPFSAATSGGDDYVVYKGTGTSVTITNLPEDTQFWVAVYSASGLGASGVTGVRYKSPTTATGTETTISGTTAPSIDTPTFSSVTATSAVLGGHVVSVGTGPVADQQGTVWNHTGGSPTENLAYEGSAPADDTAFTHLRDTPTMNSADQVFFRAFVEQSSTPYYSDVASFYTYPANDPTGFSIDPPGAFSLTINWTNSTETGDAGGSIVVVSEIDNSITAPSDGTDYTADASYPFSTATSGGNDYVVYKGTDTSVTITGLAGQTQFWVAVYSYSGTGAGVTGVRYKTDGTPATGTETTAKNWSQASNLWTHNIASTAMTFYWTEGIGDGSIAVLKEGAPVDVTPTDGIEHLADSTFQSGANLGGGNYVVYRGNGESVHVTGLTQGLTYHAAVYTYTGSGALIEYLLPSPAIGSETTIANTPHNVAVMNIDDSVTCSSGCHGAHGGTLIPRGADQEAMCTTCHQPVGGMLGAEDKLNFSLHTNTKDSPPSPPDSPGVVDCGSCHELHNASGDNTTYTQNPDTLAWDYNLHFLRANPDKYIQNALGSDLVTHTDANSEDWAFEDGLAYQGPCQICHMQTPTGYQNTSAGNDIHQGGDLGNVNCRGCHDHGGNFAGGGGDCTACHNSVQDKDGVGGTPGRRIVTTEFSGGSIVSSHLPGTLDAADCEVCHDQSSHQAGQVKLFDVDGGTSTLIASYVDPRTDSTEAAKLTTFCLACHDLDGANTDTTPFTTGNTVIDIDSDWNASPTPASHNAAGNVSCFGDGAFGCHGSGHGGQKLTILAPAESGPGTNNSDEREQFCFNCHDGNPAIDILTLFTGSATDFWVKGDNDNSAGADINQRHDVLPADQAISGAMLTCNNCHTPHADNGVSPVNLIPFTTTLIGDYDPLGSYVQDGFNFTYANGTNQDPVNPAGCNPANGTPATGCETVPGRTEPDYVEFCLTCHDGTIPAASGVTMSSGMINMATAYQADHHGRVTGGGASQGYLKPPWNTVGATTDPDPYASFNCSICHGPHGGDNIYNLRTSIKVAGVQMEVGGWTGDTIGEPRASQAADLTTYILPPMDGRNIDEEIGVQEDHYWGAWCSFCHQMDSHGQAEDNACRSGHMHGGGAF